MAESGAVMLPKNVRPVHYRLTLTPDLAEATFSGEVSIDLEILEPTDTVVLNAIELDIASASLRLADGSECKGEVTLDNDEETAAFRFGSPLPAGPATLDISFTGELNDKLRGFYRSRYGDASGEERYLATTQFEATDARRAFPCWDEPAMKASFQVTLVVPSDLQAVSNTPVERECEDRGGMRRVEYAKTPVMSTYLLAFVVGDLRSIERRADNGTLIRVWATPGNEGKGEFALDVSCRLLAYFNDYFGIPYPLEKLDHLAIPDFAAGAMENWGAITYREPALLVDAEESSVATRRRVAAIVSHEMAHMWFGDLVTMGWWNDLWLNESFASWMGDKAVDNIFPDWQVWTEFVSNDTNEALSLDGLKSSHPIEQEVNHPAEIGQLFDAISYSKGGSVLRMLENFLGAEAFRKGINRYLDRHQYRNAATRDLWDALGEASGQPVAEMMDSWVQQTGYPVLDVGSRRSGDSLEVTARQGRFVYEHLIDPDEADDTTWRVPLNVTTSAGEAPEPVLLSQRQGTISVPAPDGDAWVKVNPEQTGFYRVNYTGEGWAGLRTAIERATVSAIDRLGLQDDAFALSRAGYMPVSELLDLARAYVNETEYAVWSDLSANMASLDNLLADQPYHDDFRAYARGVSQAAGRKIGWDARPGDGELDALLRSTLLSSLGRYGDQDTLDEAARRFARFADAGEAVHPDIRDVVQGLAARQGGKPVFDTQWSMYLEAGSEEEKVRFLRAIAQVDEGALLDELLRRSLTPEVRVHNTVSVVVSVASNRRGRDLAWQFLKENWDELDRRYGEGGFGLMRLVSLTQRFSTLRMHDEVEAFFADHPAPAAERTVRQSLERIRLNAAWLERNAAEVGKYLSRR